MTRSAPDATGPATTPSGEAPARRSLRVRLTAITAGLLCVALAAGAVSLTTVLSRSRVAALDDIVRERASTVAALADDDRLPDALPVREPGEVVQIVDAQGRVVASSPNASRTLPVLADAEVEALLRSADRDPGEVVVGATDASAYDGPARVAVVGARHDGEDVLVVATVPVAEVRDLLRALSLALVGVVPVLTAGLALAVWLVLGRALRPVEQMRRAAEQVAVAGGPGSIPVGPRDDELAALARTLNTMLDRLDAAAARQQRFVADAAHELRSPLAAVRATVDVARAHPDAYPVAELAADLEPEVLRVQSLVEDLLLLARVGARPTPADAADLADVVRGAVSASRFAVPGAVVPRLEVRDADAGTVRGDVDALTRVVRNLLDNAARHAAGRVVVTAGAHEVVVEDDGAGVPEADRERVLERFVRLDEAREREAGGSGLGLAIAREVAREHGGDVLLGSSSLGGLEARLALPVPRAADAGATASRATGTPGTARTTRRP
ncbi:sensor histidine kinase [Cellulomonas carbonis]|uniref:sensor histidine kinase n=1 Tax=Cellulomonas carbonis TaxID=1386092 RepID=UPI0009DF2A1E|nr:ATP-binding protein [Cellulomonas carbonis]GGB99298.1 two-component sensor histidine kinase [Cellulomonas carbonis]